MNQLFLLLFMVFCHVIADYNLQGWLANAKQVSWWVKNAPEPLYMNDWVMALLMHSFSWTFMIMLPIAIYYNFAVDIGFLFVFAVNVLIHAAVDNLKANLGKINLICDQMLHLAQIVITFMIATA